MCNAVRLGLIATLILFAAEKASAEGAVVMGAGLTSCGTMIAEVSGPDVPEKAFLIGMHQQWMQGFMSAINFFSRESDTRVVLDDIDGQWLWLKNYCEDNPLENVMVGVIVLYEVLAAKQGLPAYFQPQLTKPESK